MTSEELNVYNSNVVNLYFKEIKRFICITINFILPNIPYK